MDNTTVFFEAKYGEALISSGMSQVARSELQ